MFPLKASVNHADWNYTLHMLCFASASAERKKQRRLFFPPILHHSGYSVSGVFHRKTSSSLFWRDAFILKGYVTKCIICIMGLCNSMLSVACRAHWELINMLWLQSQAQTVAKLWLEILYKFAVFTLGSQKFFFGVFLISFTVVYSVWLCKHKDISLITSLYHSII